MHRLDQQHTINATLLAAAGRLSCAVKSFSNSFAYAVLGAGLAADLVVAKALGVGWGLAAVWGLGLTQRPGLVPASLLSLGPPWLEGTVMGIMAGLVAAQLCSKQAAVVAGSPLP